MAASEWDSSCRLCAEEQNEMFSIFGEEGLRRKVAHKLRVCLPVLVYKTDPLPKTICQFCAARLDDVYEFREYCLNVYKSMHRKLSSLKHLKSVQIYLDAINNSPDPCQVSLLHLLHFLATKNFSFRFRFPDCLEKSVSV